MAEGENAADQNRGKIKSSVEKERRAARGEKSVEQPARGSTPETGICSRSKNTTECGKVSSSHFVWQIKQKQRGDRV